MLILNPSSVKFGAMPWENVGSIAVNRAAAEKLVEWTAGGPHVAFADVPRQRVEIAVKHGLTRGDMDGPRPGERATLVWYTAPGASDAGRRKASADCVVLDVTHEIALGRIAMRSVTLLALSSDGSTDPIVLSDAES